MVLCTPFPVGGWREENRGVAEDSTPRRKENKHGRVVTPWGRPPWRSWERGAEGMPPWYTAWRYMQGLHNHWRTCCPDIMCSSIQSYTFVSIYPTCDWNENLEVSYLKDYWIYMYLFCFIAHRTILSLRLFMYIIQCLRGYGWKYLNHCQCQK